MLGAIIGDIVGSRFEWDNHKSKDFELLNHQCFFTDDSVMSLALCEALLQDENEFVDLSERAVKCMRELGKHYPDVGYGGGFSRWLVSDNPQPYNSFGNGAAMRVSGCGYAATSIEQARQLSKTVTAVTHNHPEGLKGAEAAFPTPIGTRRAASINGIRCLPFVWTPRTATAEKPNTKRSFIWITTPGTLWNWN